MIADDLTLLAYRKYYNPLFFTMRNVAPSTFCIYLSRLCLRGQEPLSDKPNNVKTISFYYFSLLDRRSSG